jgi:ABC-type nitrate/sulfonate/bicarbonate transport system permease component
MTHSTVSELIRRSGLTQRYSAGHVRGLGGIAGSLYDVSTVLANLPIVGLMSLLLLGAVSRLEWWVLRWRFLALSA